MNDSLALDGKVRELLSEAHAWRLLSLLFERPTAGWSEEVAALAAGLRDPDLADAARSAPEASEAEYLAWLGPGGVVSAREAGHRETTDPAHVLAEIESYHRAFGFAPAREDPPDHVAVETAFVGYLGLKEAFALAQGEAEAASIAAEASRTFVERHLSTCAQPIAEAIGARSDGYLARAARVLFARVGPRPPDLEGGWVPRGLDVFECPAACEGMTHP